MMFIKLNYANIVQLRHQQWSPNIVNIELQVQKNVFLYAS